ncbi:MAG: flagellar basal body-associated FliL family protein [Sideroxydans sp.]|nr:flagellar basal body-associated FliL family protein [Sideroxydans sp.]
MSKPAKPAKAAAPAAEGDAPPKKSKKMLFIIIGVVVLLLAGAAGWYFTMGNKGAEEHKEEAAVAPVEVPTFIPLGDHFTVNLVSEEGNDPYLQAGITLKVLDPLLDAKIKATMPEIRSKLLFILSSKKPSELSTIEGKRILVSQIITATDKILGVGEEHGAHDEDEDVDHAASGVAGHDAHADEVDAHAAAPAHGAPATHGEPAHGGAAEHGEAATHDEAAGSAVAAAPAAPIIDVSTKKTGVVDVLFSDFIIQ